MSTGSLIFLLLIVGSFAAMFAMHRGGHAGSAMGGCCGGGGHGHGDDDHEHDHRPEAEEKGTPILGPPGTQSTQPVPASAGHGDHQHRGC